MSYLQNITRFSKADNLGGLISLRVIRAADVASIPDPVSGVVYGNITLKPGKSMVLWEVTLETPRTRSNSRSTREGSAKTNSIEFTVPKDRAGIRRQFELAEDDTFVVLFTDSNGTQKIFGQIDAPVRFEFNHDSGGSFGSRNAYEGRFYFEGPDNIYFYNGAVPTPPAGASPAVVMYNGSPIASLAPGETLNITSDFGFTDFYVS